MPFSVFDIAGPIMVGPSSSHTAGAVKIGQLARAIFDGTPKRVRFLLHGSFADVYKGHATDRALLAGVMKFKTSDPRIKDAFSIARKKGLSYSFADTDLGPGMHPNAVKIILEDDLRSVSITGISIGGGNVEICNINGFSVEIRAVAGKYKSLIFSHKDLPSVLTSIVGRLAACGLKIVDIQTSRIGSESLSVVHIDGPDLHLRAVLELEKISGVDFVRSLTRLEYE